MCSLPSHLSMGKINSSWYTSNTDVWATPKAVFADLDAEFHFTLDPCALAENAKCREFFTPEQNGLLQDWGGHTVFVNPPFSQMKLWAKKCYEESRKPNTKVVMLIPARTDTSYFHDYIYHKSELRFLRGRLHYNEAKQGAPFPSMVVVFNPPTDEEIHSHTDDSAPLLLWGNEE